MQFKDLPEQEQIQHCKNEFVKLLTAIAQEPKTLTDYIPAPKEPQLEKLTDTMSETERTAVSTRNAEAVSQHKKASDSFKKISDLVSKTERVEGCLCGTCLKVSFTGNVIPEELHPLLEEAQKRAEKAQY